MNEKYTVYNEVFINGHFTGHYRTVWHWKWTKDMQCKRDILVGDYENVGVAPKVFGNSKHISKMNNFAINSTTAAIYYSFSWFILTK